MQLLVVLNKQTMVLMRADTHYRYATYMSYIGIWLGAIIGVIQTVLIMQYSIIWILSIPSIILMIVAGIGLAEFKHYAYICLMITYWISFFVGLLLLY